MGHIEMSVWGLEQPRPKHKEKPILRNPDSCHSKGSRFGIKVSDLCRKHGISQPTYYNWKSKYGGLGASELKRIKELEVEHSKLKRMYADLAMENDALKELIEKKL